MRALAAFFQRYATRMLFLSGDAAEMGSDADERMRLVELRLRELAKSGAPIVAGPWLGEVGFEVIYWIPFLRWFCQRWEVRPERVTVLSRGGVAPWYSGLAGRYVDILSHYGAEEYQRLNFERTGGTGGMKQSARLSDFEKSILEKCGSTLPAGARILQPSEMYGLYRPYYKGQAAMSAVSKRAVFKRFSPLTADFLPDRFAAVRFYFSPNFPATEANADFARRVVSNLAVKMPVVLLETGLRLDDHSEIDFSGIPNVLSIAERTTPANNLEVQSRALSRAQVFVGTYGGTAYAAALYGTPAVTFYSDPKPFNPYHLDLARYAVSAAGGGSLISIPTDAVSELSGLLDSAAQIPAKTRLATDVPIAPKAKQKPVREEKSPRKSWIQIFKSIGPIRRGGTAVAAGLMKIPAFRRFLLERYLAVSTAKKSVFRIPRVSDTLSGYQEAAGAVEALLEALVKRNRRIIAGPWLGEVGFEVLYWAPFLRWVQERFGVDSRRWLIISRGGAEFMYQGLGAEYVDILDHFSTEEYCRGNERRVIEQGGGLKQVIISEFDREVLRRVLPPRLEKEAVLLHPLYMFQLFSLFWKRVAPYSLLDSHARFSLLKPAGPAPWISHLPEEYVAVRFYFSPPFPDTPENRRFAARAVQAVARKYPVVLLNPEVILDDHSDAAVRDDGRVFRVNQWMSPGSNLRVQAQVLQRAKAFVGTYGGLSYLAPLCGVPALSFYSDPRLFNIQHIEVAERVLPALQGAGSWRCQSTADLDLLDGVLGDFAGSARVNA